MNEQYNLRNSLIIWRGKFKHATRDFIKHFFHGELDGNWNMLLVLLLTTSYPLFFYNTYDFYTAYVGIAYFFIDYAAVFLISLLPNKKLQKICFGIVFFILGIYSIMMLACLITTHGPLSADIVAAVMATNASETKEFLSLYFNTKMLMALLGLVAILAVVIVTLRKFKTIHKAICRGGVIVFLACGCLFAHNNAIVQETVFGFIQSCIDVSNTTTSLVKRLHPQVNIVSKDQPPLIIWIIGESFTRHHSSLYGYEKTTNPLLQKRVNSGEAFVFKNVTSAELHTQESFELMMSTYEKRMGKKTKWNECTTFPDIARAAGYHTVWISNQSKKGLFDNVVSQYAEMCDTSIFIGNKYSGTRRVSFDGELLPITASMLKRCGVKEIFVVHLMGSHGAFDRRYPDEFKYFKESDYTNRPANQRKTMAQYDNTVLYNDYVVNKILDMVSRRDAIVVYAPDHGLDVYESRADYVGHGLATNEVSRKAGTEVPFIIYMTDKFKARHANIAERVKPNLSRNFNEENIVYVMMDLMQCDFNPPTVDSKSLLRKNK